MSCRTRRVALAVKAAIGLIGKMLAQRAQLPVLRPELVAPLRNAMRFVDGEEGDRNALQPADGVLPRQPLRRKIQQPVRALRAPAASPRAARSEASELLSTAAGIPICASCAAWSCISAISGETTTTVCPSTSAGNW